MAMHFLIIILLLAFIFPALGRCLGGLVRGFFWLILVVIGLAAIGALVHG
jgi:hypothetical protein